MYTYMVTVDSQLNILINKKTISLSSLLPPSPSSIVSTSSKLKLNQNQKFLKPWQSHKPQDHRKFHSSEFHQKFPPKFHWKFHLVSLEVHTSTHQNHALNFDGVNPASPTKDWTFLSLRLFLGHRKSNP
jgi:hypothetical protein